MRVPLTKGAKRHSLSMTLKIRSEWDMSKIPLTILYVLLFSSALSLKVDLNIGLVSMLLGSLMSLLILSQRRFHIKGRKRGFHWFTWSLHSLLLIAVYMASFGVANIVGSGRKFSARMAVSTLRTLHWAERQCASAVGRFCRISEMKLERRVEGLKTPMLRTDFHRVIEGEDHRPFRPPHGEALDSPEYAQLGQYLIMLRETPKRGEGTWIAYAWPSNDGTLQTFCIDDREEILELPINERGEATYLGLARRPSVNACLGALHSDPNPPLTEEMKSAIAKGEKPPPHVHLGRDQLTWQRWRGKRTRISKSKR